MDGFITLDRIAWNPGALIAGPIVRPALRRWPGPPTRSPVWTRCSPTRRRREPPPRGCRDARVGSGRPAVSFGPRSSSRRRTPCGRRSRAPPHSRLCRAGASSVASPNVQPCSAAFAAECEPPPPRNAAIELMVVTLPFSSVIAGTRASVSSTAVNTLVRQSNSHAAATPANPSTGDRSMPPALLTTTSTPPPDHASSSCAARSTSAGRVRSAVTASAGSWPRKASCRPLACRTAVHVVASGAGRRPTTATRTPSWARRTAIARPMPVPPAEERAHRSSMTAIPASQAAMDHHHDTNRGGGPACREVEIGRNLPPVARRKA